MKLILAMIHPDKREAVRSALESTETPLIYASDVLDLRELSSQVFRGLPYRAPQIKTRLEILVVNDRLVDEIAEIIACAAWPEEDLQPGKSNIVVMPVEEWIPGREIAPRRTPTMAA